MNWKKNILFLFFCTLYLGAIAQKKLAYDSLPKLDSISNTFYYKNWITPSSPTQKTGLPFTKKQNNRNFFIALMLLLLFALIKTIFTKYVKDLWQITLQNTFRLSALKSQLSANQTASLLLNIYFAIITGCFINIILQQQKIVIINNWFFQLLFCCTIIGIIYLVKYVVLLILGYIFQQKKVSNDYIFIVFLCNKIIAMLLLPFVCYLLIATNYQRTFIIIALFIICLLFLFRYLFSMVIIVKQLQLKKLHFFLYLCATEIIPILLVYKLLLINGINII